MKPSLLYKTTYWSLGCTLAALTIFFGITLMRAWREYRHALHEQADASERLLLARAELQEREAYLRNLMDDAKPEFLERVVREKLGYVHPDETIFRIEHGSAR